VKQLAALRRKFRSMRAGSTRIGVISYDLKFFGDVLRDLQSQPEIEVRVDEWSSLHAHNGPATDDIIEWADIVIAEWCGPYAALASHTKRRDQRLIVRLHRFELERGLCADVDIGNVDRVITVNDHYRRRLLDELSWPAEKVVTIPNIVDGAALDLPKTESARFHLGLLGAATRRKRLDRALDIIERVRKNDDRFVLHVKTDAPANLKWVMDDPGEVAYFAEVWPRLEAMAESGAVVRHPAGADVPEWFRDIGFILSVSDDESFHLAPAEGMASRAVPVITGWPGAETVYDRRWIHGSLDDAAGEILRVGTSEASWRDAGEAAREEVQRLAPDRVLPAWRSLIESLQAPPVASSR
jgi:glycosyltransferase involved in cell wall biosynthesis